MGVVIASCISSQGAIVDESREYTNAFPVQF